MILPSSLVKRCVLLSLLVATAFLGRLWAETKASQADTQKRVSQAGAYVDKALADIIALLPPKTVPDIHPKAISLELAIKFLRSHSADLGAGADTAAVEASLDAVSNGSMRLSSASDNGDGVGAAERTEDIKKAWADVKSKVPKGIFSEKVDPPIYACIMHSGQTRLSPGNCPVCGMAMIPKQAFQVALTEPISTITAKVETPAPLQPGVETKALLHLQTNAGKPVTVNELIVIHTQPIHLLIVDESLSDYHHVHPVPSEKPGDFTFSFTPTKPGPYRLFADIVPVVTSRQEYARTDIPGTGAGQSIGSKETVLKAQIDDLTYTLSFDRDRLIRGEPITGKIHITQTTDGQPFTKLEPVMGVFAHLVGFYDDRETIMHIHPSGPDPVPADSHGGPDLEFQFIPMKAGFVRLYAQVQIGGVNKFAPFSVTFEEPPAVAVKSEPR